MNSLIVIQKLDDTFWAEYATLWKASGEVSPFQAPNYLKHLFACTSDKVLALKLSSKGRLLGAVVLRVHKNNSLSFLSDIKTDTNFFVFHKECTEDDFRFFFSAFLEEIKSRKWTITLNSQPIWADYMPVFSDLLKKSALYTLNIRYSVCPVVDAVTAGELFQLVNTSTRFRTAASKIKKTEGARFEVFTGDDDLENWVDDFCYSHINRWEKTSTPSTYNNPENKKFLLNCLKAWLKDNVLIRFSIKLNKERIGFAIGLIENRSLIHHSHTILQDYQKLSPGIALIHFMVEWMSLNDFNRLDFGYGDEKFKYFLANKELVLDRIFITYKGNYPFILKSRMINAVKKNQKAYDFYKNKIKIPLNNLGKKQTE